MDLDADMIPTSPSADSSPSSSDLDTEVTLHPRPSSWVFLDCLAYMYGLTCLLWMTSRFLVCVCVCGVGEAVDGVLLPGPEHDAGDADGRVGVRRAEGAGGRRGERGGAAARGAGSRGGGEGRGRVAAPPPPSEAARELVAAVPGPRCAADVAGRVPGHGAAARGRGLPLRRQRRRRVGARDGRGAVRERKGAASSAARGRRGGGEGQVAAAAGVGWLVDLDGDGVGVPGAPAGAAHRHLQRRSRVNVVNKLQLSRFGEGVFRDKNGVDASLIKPPCPCFFSH